MTSKTLNNVVNEQTITLNALIYGYAGHSLVTPHAAIQQVWWTEERINEKVTTDFITSRIRPDNRAMLHKPVGFGDLTDDTYIDWILERARRLFLVLADVGEADKIFTVVQNSWDDDDLPLGIDDIEKLSLEDRRNDGQVNLRFYNQQFTFLLRELDEGVHVDYAPNEVLPLEYVISLPPAVSLQHWSRVHRPKRPNEVYVRRKFPLGNAENPMAFEMDFIMDAESARMVEHDHIAPVWASYTAKGTGYILTNFVGQHTLRTFIDHRKPAQYERLPKPERRYLILGWLHCLADAVATLHQMGFCHSNIRPSNILIDERNNIAFSDIGSLETFQKDKKPDAMEDYIYSAPETHNKPLAPEADTSAPAPIIGGSFRKDSARKESVASKTSSNSSGTTAGSHGRKLSKIPANEFSGFNFGFRRTKPKPKPRSREHETEKADVYGLGCIFLELLTFMMKKKPHEFTKHRSSKQVINIGGKNHRTDPSYHANAEKVETWVKIIEEESFKHDDDAFRSIPHIANLIRSMLSRAPTFRPSARDVRDRLLDILLHYTAIPDIHCSSHKHDINGLANSSTTSGSDRASTMTSSRASSISMSTISTATGSSFSLASSTSTGSSSDADTIRYGLGASSPGGSRVSSILAGYAVSRERLESVSEFDDSESVATIEIDSFPQAGSGSGYGAGGVGAAGMGSGIAFNSVDPFASVDPRAMQPISVASESPRSPTTAMPPLSPTDSLPPMSPTSPMPPMNPTSPLPPLNPTSPLPPLSPRTSSLPRSPAGPSNPSANTKAKFKPWGTPFLLTP